jgi:hypothetical protein
MAVLLQRYVQKRIDAGRFAKQFHALHHELPDNWTDIDHTVVNILDIVHSDVSFYQPNARLRKTLDEDPQLDYYNSRELHLRAQLAYTKLAIHLRRVIQPMDQRATAFSRLVRNFAAGKMTADAFGREFLYFWNTRAAEKLRASKRLGPHAYDIFNAVYYHVPDKTLREALRRTSKVMPYYSDDELKAFVASALKKTSTRR